MRRKRLGTVLAFEGSFASVCALVNDEIWVLYKRFLTARVVTNERSDPLVTKEMSLKSVFPGETEPTLGIVALVWLYFIVGLQV